MFKYEIVGYSFILLCLWLFTLVGCAPPMHTDTYSAPAPIDGKNGKDGINGTNGVNGAQGQQGIPGTDASPATIVPLCPGVSNYGVFIEVGICLQGKLYGVYSDHGGFMTYLANGAYSSNAIGSACNLTITGCVVSH